MRTRARGLTVLEVLLAMVVLGIVTAAVMVTYVSSIRNNADAGRRFRLNGATNRPSLSIR